MLNNIGGNISNLGEKVPGAGTLGNLGSKLPGNLNSLNPTNLAGNFTGGSGAAGNEVFRSYPSTPRVDVVTPKLYRTHQNNFMTHLYV